MRSWSSSRHPSHMSVASGITVIPRINTMRLRGGSADPLENISGTPVYTHGVQVWRRVCAVSVKTVALGSHQRWISSILPLMLDAPTGIGARTAQHDRLPVRLF